MLYEFNTVVAVKPVDCGKWYIDGDNIKPIEIESDSLKTALNEYIATVTSNPYYHEVSKTALKNKKGMYRDTKDGTKQIGYVITAKTSFPADDYCSKWIDKYIDLWVEIRTTEYLNKY